MNRTDKKPHGVVSAMGASESAHDIIRVPAIPVATIPEPMHGSERRDAVLRTMLAYASSPELATIQRALADGFQQIRKGRAEEALKAAGFVWPASLKPRILGAVVRAMAGAGLICEISVVKGYSGRSHAGRVSVWIWIGGVA